MKLGFFQLLIETCRGTTVYYHVLRQSPWRALFHFLLLCVICTLAVWGYKMPSMAREVDTGYERITKDCGDIVSNEAGIFPTKDPQRNRMIFSMPRLELTYIADPEVEMPKINIGIAGTGVVWLPKAMLLWTSEYDKDYYLIYPFVNGKPQKMEKISPDQLNGYIKELNRKVSEVKNTELNPFEILLNSPGIMKAYLYVFSLAILFGMIFLQFMFFILMIALIFSVLGSRRLQGKLFFRDYFVLNCYIAFPCLLISAVWLALEPPFLNFQWISILSFSIYFMIVMGRIERWLSPPPPDESGE